MWRASWEQLGFWCVYFHGGEQEASGGVKVDSLLTLSTYRVMYGMCCQTGLGNPNFLSSPPQRTLIAPIPRPLPDAPRPFGPCMILRRLSS